MKYIAIVLLILVSTPSISCDCKLIENLSEAQRRQFQKSDLVFIGEVVSSENNKDIYKLKVVELFKGNPKDKIVAGTSNDSCSHFPIKEEGLWLVYANFLSDGRIYISACGLSRNFKFPYTFSEETQLPPPPKPSNDVIMDQINGEIMMMEYKNKALLVLKKEIEQLRKLK